MTEGVERPAIPLPDDEMGTPSASRRSANAIPWRRVFVTLATMALAVLELACVLAGLACAVMGALRWGSPEANTWLQGAVFLILTAVWLGLSDGR